VRTWVGTVRGLFVAVASGAPMQSMEEVTVVAGVGIVGDRYAAGRGHFSRPARSGQDLTLVEEEAIAALLRDYEIDVDLADTRRNVVTTGVPLNHLIGEEFRVGETVVRGVRLAEPCSHLARLAGVPKLREALVHRGGLRADVVVGGVVRVGDPIEPLP
jgi:MOSC domain-containing protein YiiM